LHVGYVRLQPLLVEEVFMSRVSYTLALRCIGQDLVRRGLKTFEIKPEGGHFMVRPGDGSGSVEARQVIRYTPAAIDLIDRAGEAHRGKISDSEFLHQAQMLRAIGDYLDRYNSTLIRIAKIQEDFAECPFRVEYRTREGDEIVDDRPGTVIFDMCVLMVQKRRQQGAMKTPAVKPR
jgi:hypothetical protein